jgi:mevalonate kinase
MDRNQSLLESMGVSSQEIDRLIQSARKGGAWGAKLSGAGLGGNVLALPPPGRLSRVKEALREAGAVRLIETEVRP